MMCSFFCRLSHSFLQIALIQNTDIYIFSLILSLILFHRSNIVFKTAGVVLEEMRDRGLNALDYKTIILDEVHERSVESDLLLVCVKQFLMKNNDLRLTYFQYYT